MESASSTQSLRTTSLTSMSGRYSSAPLRAPYLPPAPKKPLFYDYSEDFEDVVEPLDVCPIAPIPRRVSITFSPLMAENDHGTVSDVEAEDGDDEDVLACLRHTTITKDANTDDSSEREQYRSVSQLGYRSSSGQITPYTTGGLASVQMHLSGQEDEAMEGYESPPMTLKEQEDAMKTCAPMFTDFTTETPHRTMSIKGSTVDCTIQPDTPAVGFNTIRSDPLNFRDGNHEAVKRRDDSNGLEPDGCTSVVIVNGGSYQEESSPNAFTSSPPAGASSKRYSDYCKDSRHFSLSSGLSDLACFAKYIDRHIQASGTEENSRDDISAIPPSRTAPGPDFASAQDQNRKAMPPPPRKSSLQPCGVHSIQLKANPGPCLDDELDQFQVVSTRSGPTLVPQPISPAKMLRVKNSIPQLMKALPALPGYSPAPESPFGPAVVPIDFEPFEISRLTEARSTLTEANVLGKRGHSEDAPKGHDPFVFDRRACQPRLKLKHTTSCASGQSRDLRLGYFEQSGVYLPAQHIKRPSTAEQPSHAPVKRRLPIKISRTALTSTRCEDTGTVRRRPGLKKSGTVSKLTSKQPIDLFGDPMALQATGTCIPQPMIVKSQDSPLEPALPHTPVAEGRRHVHADDAILPFAEIRLSSLDSPYVESEAHGEIGMQSYLSDSNINTPWRGLKTKISDLKAKLSDPRSHQQLQLRNGIHETHMPKPGVSSSKTCKDLLSGMSQSKNHKNPTPHRVGNKLGRFMQSAKHKLRAWGQHRRKID